MTTLPDPQAVFLWILKQYGVPGVVLAAIATIFALTAWWALLKAAHGWAVGATTAARRQVVRGIGARATSLLGLGIATIGFPPAICAFPKLADTFNRCLPGGVNPS